LFETDVDLLAMRSFYNLRFIRRYEIALKLYLEGYWPEAKLIFNEVSRTKGSKDDASIALINFMGSYNFLVPDDWKCFRIMSSK
jgi:hypothetical protein